MQAFREAILAELGRAPAVIEPGRFHRFATSDRRSDDAGWCKMFYGLRHGVFGCHRQGISRAWSSAIAVGVTRAQCAALARQQMAAAVEHDALRRRQWAWNARRIAEVWAQCVRLTPGDPVMRYLKRRGFDGVWPLPEVLRLHRALPYRHGADELGKFPAMVAPVVAPDGCTVALHRTYLTPDGRKANVPNPKKLTGAAGLLAGACIPLHKPSRGSIGVAEGIETALAARCASGIPTVASYCASNLATWQWPVDVRRLVIFADADAAGRDAAEALSGRAMAARLRCDVLTPSAEGADWCDAWADALRAGAVGAT